MFDFKFDWDESISVGIEEIDKQNQQLFKIGRDIEQLILTGCRATTGEELLKLLCEIREYVTYHFYTQERLIEKINKEGLENHKKQHEEFKRIINAIDCDELVQNPVRELKKIKGLLQDWLFIHIMQEDKKILKIK